MVDAFSNPPLNPTSGNREIIGSGLKEQVGKSWMLEEKE